MQSYYFFCKPQNISYTFFLHQDNTPNIFL